MTDLKKEEGSMENNPETEEGAAAPEIAGAGTVLSPLSGAYLLIILGEPLSLEHKEKILQKLKQGRWNREDRTYAPSMIHSASGDHFSFLLEIWSVLRNFEMWGRTDHVQSRDHYLTVGRPLGSKTYLILLWPLLASCCVKFAFCTDQPCSTVT